MIYYNLQSQYPGDITKHCGLTIDEVDHNFYELEEMIYHLTPSGNNPKQRFWSFSGNVKSFPFYNTLEKEMINSNTCKISGTVKDGILSFGVDSTDLYGVSVMLYGNSFLNEIILPKTSIAPVTNSLRIVASAENLPDNEIAFHIKNDDSSLEPIYIETVERKLYLKCEYEGNVIVNCVFVFDNDLIIEDLNPSVWRDEYIWRDLYVWKTSLGF